MTSKFRQVQDFHKMMDGQVTQKIKPFDDQTARHRADFKIEEIMEFLYASCDNQKQFEQLKDEMHANIDKAAQKIQSKSHPEDKLTGEVDALVDLLYLTYGSFVLMGVDPTPFFDIVHEANMGKLFPDGKAHFDPITHKILKPDYWEEQYAPEGKLKALLEELKEKERKG